MSRVALHVLVGLERATEQTADGHWTVALTDADGNQVYKRGGYTTQKTGQDAARAWIRDNYEAPPRITRAPRKAAPGLRDLTDAGNGMQLVRVMRRKAATNNEAAARYRQQADLLETEAKRLTAAADLLEGPEDA